MTGAGRLKTVIYALLPEVMPSLASIALYIWEFNVRASTVLGIVGAGGIGQELKSSIDLLDFPRVFAILLIILVMVTAIVPVPPSGTVPNRRFVGATLNAEMPVPDIVIAKFSALMPNSSIARSGWRAAAAMIAFSTGASSVFAFSRSVVFSSTATRAV